MSFLFLYVRNNVSFIRSLNIVSPLAVSQASPISAGSRSVLGRKPDRTVAVLSANLCLDLLKFSVRVN